MIINQFKSLVLVMTYLVLTINSFATYNIGDIVDDIAFQETTWDQNGVPTTIGRTMSEFINNDIPVLIYFYDISYS